MLSDFVKLNASVIRAHVKANGLKYCWIAEQAGIAQTTLRRALSGSTVHVTRKTASQIARVLELPVRYVARELTDAERAERSKMCRRAARPKKERPAFSVDRRGIITAHKPLIIYGPVVGGGRGGGEDKNA